ncbi:MAG: sugar phosphate isomerase/epimerase [bacterium]|nr:sugar phosphate isomerase/epimerase [candidate division KSB1 bacterium]MDH7560430.1 sugar phosphate isomerase/epimerase [bacterium]
MARTLCAALLLASWVGCATRTPAPPLAVQCWTFRAFTFIEALDRIQELGLSAVQAYPGQPLAANLPGAVFDHRMPEEQVNWVEKALAERGLRLVAYGVVDVGRDEESMRPVFDFAKRLHIPTVVAEPEFEALPLLERIAKEYDIRVAIHNHPAPSRYARPETLNEQIRQRDHHLGACADTGHWLRSGVVPVEALRLLRGRILDVHLKDLNAFARRDATDVPCGQGKANIRAVVAELRRQGYDGYLCIEYENEEQRDNPSPAVRRSIAYLNKLGCR